MLCTDRATGTSPQETLHAGGTMKVYCHPPALWEPAQVELNAPAVGLVAQHELSHRVLIEKQSHGGNISLQL